MRQYHVTTKGFDETIRALGDLPNALDLTRNGFGNQLLDIASRGIAGRSNVQLAPDGSPWKPNSPEYAKSKGYLPVGVKTGLMLQAVQIEGVRKIMPGDAEQTYGIDQAAREHAAGFTGSDVQGRDSRGRFTGIRDGRPFYEMADDDQELMIAVCERKIEDAIKKI